jgi:hypothetical protein
VAESVVVPVPAESLVEPPVVVVVLAELVEGSVLASDEVLALVAELVPSLVEVVVSDEVDSVPEPVESESEPPSSPQPSTRVRATSTVGVRMLGS